MIAAARAVLDGRPRLAFVLVAVRSILWIAAGHPVGLLAAVSAWRLGAPALATIAVAVLLDAVAIAWSRQQGPGVGRVIWLWAMACRFRRRWPVLFNDADPRRLRFTGLLSRNRYNGAGGLRPVLAAPLLGLTPVSLRGTTAEWAVLTVAAHTPTELADVVERIADLDARLAKSQIHQAPAPLGHGRLCITFFDATERAAS